jgi:hypothetical protein
MQQSSPELLVHVYIYPQTLIRSCHAVPHSCSAFTCHVLHQVAGTCCCSLNTQHRELPCWHHGKHHLVFFRQQDRWQQPLQRPSQTQACRVLASPLSAPCWSLCSGQRSLQSCSCSTTTTAHHPCIAPIDPSCHSKQAHSHAWERREDDACHPPLHSPLSKL